MTEPAAKHETKPDIHKALPCPFCGGENITSNEWTMDEDNAQKFDADEWGEIWAFECMDCLGAAPIKTWNNRPDPWVSEEERLPEPGQQALWFQKDNLSESGWYTLHTMNPPGTGQISIPAFGIHWMPLPDKPEAP